MPRIPSITSFAAKFLFAAALARAEMIRLPVTADTSICCHPEEREFTPGGCPRIKLKGTENVILVNFDLSPLVGKLVTRAVLHMKETESNLMVRRVGVSTVAVPWTEGAGESYESRGGGACFLRPASESDWAEPGSDFLGAVWGRSGTFWAQAQAARGADGWWTLPVEGRFLEACAAGLSFGLAFSDDNGQTMNIARELMPKANFSNNFFFAREQSGAAPWMEADVAPAPPRKPEPVSVDVLPRPAGADARAGGAEAVWAGPAGTEALLGYRLRVSSAGKPAVAPPRWRVPAVPPAGARTRALLGGLPPGAGLLVEIEAVGRGGVVAGSGRGAGFASGARASDVPLVLRESLPPSGTPPRSRLATVWAVPDGAKVNPVTGNALEEAGVPYEGAPGGSWRFANPAWSGRDRTVSLAAMRNEWAGFSLICETGDLRPIAFRVKTGELRGPGGALLPASAIRLSRAWYQHAGKAPRGWYADPLLPLAAGESFSVPDARNAVPGQFTQAVYAELHVPRDAQPGVYEGPLAVDAGGEPLPITLSLRVARAMMPDAARFVWSLNAYDPPEPERAYYALAHAHRGTLVILHYSHSGNTSPGAVPSVTGKGAAAHVADWAGWDRRFGPLFDGSAFAGTEREDVPLDHFYLALSENYPTPMSDGYIWNHLRIEEHWDKAGSIEEGFSREYQDAWVAVAVDYEKHIKEKGWKTSFQVYLNDKYFYKQFDSKRKSWGNGTSFWLLDEPQHIDDFLALRFFGRMLRAAQAGDRSRLIFRADLSRPEWGRDALDELVDLDVDGAFAKQRPLLEEMRERHGRRIWTYGDLPPSTAPAAALSAQALDLWGRGVDGYVPWLVLGGEENWKEFATTCLLYTGKPFGVDGPCASLRLKALRRAEQDVEYAGLLAEHRGLLRDDPNRTRIGGLLAAALPPAGREVALDEQGGFFPSYNAPAPARLEAFRAAVREALH